METFINQNYIYEKILKDDIKPALRILKRD